VCSARFRALSETREATEQRLALALTLGAFAFALVVQSGFFSWSTRVRGDIDSPRGVAFTMLGGAWQGRAVIGPGPAWFGGLYPLTLGWSARILGVSFDGLVSVVSWLTPLALPAALWMLGRRVWPDRPLGRGLLVFVGTVGSSLATDSRAEWVQSVLPSGANVWPLYPRDAALVLLPVALALAMRSDRWRDAVWSGLVAATAVCVHGQIGAATIGVVAGWYAWRGLRGEGDAWVRNGAVAVGTALAGSLWWWAPRVWAWWEYRPLVLDNFPSFAPLDLTPVGLVVALGLVGIMAVTGALFARGARWTVLGFFLVWIALDIPLVIVTQLAGNPNATTARRSLLLIGVPLVVLAANGALRLADRFDGRVVVPVLVVALCIPSVAEVLHMRDFVGRRWSARAIGTEGEQQEIWSPAIADLRRAVEDRGQVSVLAPSADGVVVWTQSGAQPYGPALRGTIKLGLDPARTTGIGYLTRVHETERAFSGGWGALCELVSRRHLPYVVVRADRETVAVYDRTPPARYRVAPQDRDRASLTRTVAPGVYYRDRNVREALVLARGRSIPVGFADPRVRRVVVEGTWTPGAPDVPRVGLVLPDGRRIAPRSEHVGWLRRFSFATPDGVPRGARIEGRMPFGISRVQGFVARPGGVAPGRATRFGPAAVALPRGVVCGAVPKAARSGQE
jgi:hypothetical protein